MILGFVQPVPNMIKSVPSSDVINQKGSDCSPVIGPGDRSEILLASGVPDLELDLLLANQDGLRPEFNSDCDVVVLSGFILDELQNEAGFAHSRVSNENELEKVMISIHAFNISL